MDLLGLKNGPNFGRNLAQVPLSLLNSFPVLDDGHAHRGREVRQLIGGAAAAAGEVLGGVDCVLQQRAHVAEGVAVPHPRQDL